MVLRRVGLVQEGDGEEGLVQGEVLGYLDRDDRGVPGRRQMGSICKGAKRGLRNQSRALGMCLCFCVFMYVSADLCMCIHVCILNLCMCFVYVYIFLIYLFKDLSIYYISIYI